MDNETNFLKKQLGAANDPQLTSPWTKENILAGFKQFFIENGRYPTAHEIDAYKYLPSSRQIQRTFGGLVNLRKSLGLEINDYGRGANRVKIALEVNKRGNAGEKDIEQMLINQFGEYFVHVEKPLYKYIKPESKLRKDSKCRADFLVYAKNYTFCVDVFFTNSLRNFIVNVNMKNKKYTDLNIDVFIVNLNEDGNISNNAIIKYLSNRLSPLDTNIKVMNKSSFFAAIESIEPMIIKDK